MTLAQTNSAYNVDTVGNISGIESVYGDAWVLNPGTTEARVFCNLDESGSSGTHVLDSKFVNLPAGGNASVAVSGTFDFGSPYSIVLVCFTDSTTNLQAEVKDANLTALSGLSGLTVGIWKPV